MKLAEPEIPEADRSRGPNPRPRPLALRPLRAGSLRAAGPAWCCSPACRGPANPPWPALAERAGFTVIRSDEVRKELAGATTGTVPPTRVFGEGLYTRRWNERTYAECLRRAEELIFEGGRRAHRCELSRGRAAPSFLDAAHRWGITACLLLCQADPDVVRQRLESRRGDASDADWTISQKAALHWEDLSPEVCRVARPIDTSGSRELSLARALEILQGFNLFDSGA